MTAAFDQVTSNAKFQISSSPNVRTKLKQNVSGFNGTLGDVIRGVNLPEGSFREIFSSGGFGVTVSIRCWRVVKLVIFLVVLVLSPASEGCVCVGFAMSDLGSGDEGSSSQKYHQGMEQGSSEYDPGQQGQVEQELATKMLQIQSKRFYLDVKQNRRGRFIKVAEIGADGRRSQIFLALSTAAEFRDHLSAFSDFYSSLGPPNPDNVPEDGKLKSEMMIKDNRRYYLDLKENSRGRFLRVSQTITRGGPRSQVAIPAQGMIEFRDALTDLLDEFSTDEHAYKPDLPEGRHMHVDNKNFYFDIGQNNRGVYMRISEVKTNFRTAITVPEKSWPRFRDILADYCDKIKQQPAAGGGGGGGGGSAGGIAPDHQPSPLVGNNTQQDTGTSLK